MTEQARPIFRTAVYERFVRARREPVWPRLVAPRTTRVAWALLGLFVVASALAWRTRVPTFVEASAILVPHDASAPLAGADVAWLVLVPPEGGAQVHSGSRAFLGEPANGKLELASIEPNASSPTEICRRFELSGAAELSVTQPARVALARDASSTPTPSNARIGTVCRVRVQTGDAPSLYFVPVLGPWLASK
jgi:hypothetical protein